MSLHDQILSSLPVLLGSSNPNKLEEFAELFADSAWEVASPRALKASLPAVVEDQATAAGNARKKALRYSHATGMVVLADDTELRVDGLDGAPGVRTARFAGEHATAELNRAKLLKELNARPTSERAASFLCHLCLATPTGEVLVEVSGECHGTIAEAPQGAGGFGYDSIFWIDEANKMMAELDAAERRLLTHRARAVKSLVRAVETRGD